MAVGGYNQDGGNDPLIEIYTQGQGWRALSAATTEGLPEWYPNIYQLSNGLVYAANPGTAHSSSTRTVLGSSGRARR